jgi:allophanate hydrolase subunit 1
VKRNQNLRFEPYAIHYTQIPNYGRLLVELGDEISRQINQKVRALFIGLAGHNLKGIKELVPGYRSLMVVYDPLVSSLSSFKSQIMDIWGTVDEAQLLFVCTPNRPIRCI